MLFKSVYFYFTNLSHRGRIFGNDLIQYNLRADLTINFKYL